ncbi:MAG: NifB/NifX family molybdenum-iron cluster-binding protein [Heliobacteriaceae bacterium]|nr:NifB/NifX family molybdenum-iron cluster-binding protein [Heliobacteriaceae bacterium]MDD4587128.1 NifB/NifX family molybdenum-iron cluster-binding protein [Heliobacteriaceae bacterium]
MLMTKTEQKQFRLAIPSMVPGGPEAARSGHFGRCECFTLVDFCAGKPVKIEILGNPPHVDGGCLVPVNLLAANKVNAIAVDGIGMRPLLGFRSVGIEVYAGTGAKVGAVIEAYAKGELAVLGEDAVCGAH